MSLKGKTNEEKIWNFLKENGMNDFGTAGLMGNLKAESNCSPTNLQNTYEKKFGMTDTEYTKQVDREEYKNFVKDSAGYGLAQWTYWSRKQGLLNYANQMKTSIGDLEMQLKYLMKELKVGYVSVLKVLQTATSVRQASDVVLLQFERPANQGTSVQETRAKYGQSYYNMYAAVQDKEVSKMSNSPLVSYTKISPNRSSPRNHAIDTITIHCVVGQCSVETLGNVFAPESRQASSNYGVGVDGRIGMYCEEKDRSWCSSNSVNDNRAITIEVASDTTEPYAVNDKAFAALIDLCVDICKRNGIKKLVWSTNKNDRVNHLNGCNMTVHRDYANKSCPGTYLYERQGQIAEAVNKKLGVATEVKPPVTDSKTLYRVQTGAFSVKANADAFLNKVKTAGFDTYMVKVGNLYKVQVGAYSVKSNAENMMAKLKARGFDAFITTESGTTATVSTPVASLAVGDKVKLASGAPTYGTSKQFQSWVYSSTLYVREISGNRIVISTLKSGAVTGAVDKKYLTKI